MSAQTRLAELQARKEVLRMQADAQRQMLALEVQELEHALRWVEPVVRTWHRLRPVALLAAPVAGFFLARHGRSTWRWGLNAVRACQFVSHWFKK